MTRFMMVESNMKRRSGMEETTNVACDPSYCSVTQDEDVRRRKRKWFPDLSAIPAIRNERNEFNEYPEHPFPINQGTHLISPRHPRAFSIPDLSAFSDQGHSIP
jgi:hypothetical protein